MHTATQSSHSYDFRKDFRALARPGRDRYLRECGYDPDDPRDGMDDCWATGRYYVRGLWRHLKGDQGAAEWGEPWGLAERDGPWGAAEAKKSADAYEVDMITARKESGLGELEFDTYIPLSLPNKAYDAEIREWYNQLPSVKLANERALERERQYDKAAEPQPSVPPDEVLPVFSAASLAGKQVPPREWAVPELIPFDTVTMLSGDGGVGKSVLAKQLAIAFATDTEWLGLKPECGPVVFVSAEDDQDELHRRIASIAASEGIDLADLKDLHIVALAGRDAVMGATEGRGGVVKETAVWRGLVRIVDRVRPRLIIADTLADMFAGNELARTEARQFIGQLRGLAIDYRLAVLLLSHPSLSGMASGTGTSGSTAWSNSVRSRLYLETVKGDDGVEADPDLRTLTTKKANYSARGGEIKLRWSAGRFVRYGDPLRFTFGKAGDAHAVTDEKFMSKLAKYLATGRDLSPSPNARNYAPEVLADGARPGRGRLPGKARVASVRAYEHAMERAFSADTICVKYQGPKSRLTKTIAIRYPCMNDELSMRNRIAKMMPASVFSSSLEGHLNRPLEGHLNRPLEGLS